MSKFSEIDALIVELVANGKNRFVQLEHNPILYPIARELGNVAFRVIDRRLQSLRKSGKLAYSSFTGWVVV